MRQIHDEDSFVKKTYEGYNNAQFMSLFNDDPIFFNFDTEKISFNFFGCWNSGNYTGYKMADIKPGTNANTALYLVGLEALC
jgi:hypothetical protein